jgi:hypothetical protein
MFGVHSAHIFRQAQYLQPEILFCIFGLYLDTSRVPANLVNFKTLSLEYDKIHPVPS